MRYRWSAQTGALVRAEIAPAVVEDALAKHGLNPGGPVVEVTRAGGDARFLAGERYVVEFNSTNPSAREFVRFARAHALVSAQTRLPLPPIVAIDGDRDVAPFEFCITARLPGIDGETVWPRLGLRERTEVGKAAGEALATLHGVTAARFGDLLDPRGQRDTWFDYIADRTGAALRGAIDSGRLEPANEARGRAILERLKPYLDRVRTAHLVHGAFRFSETLFTGTRLSGVLGLRHSLGGDPGMDFSLVLQANAVPLGGPLPFWAGYDRARWRDRGADRIKVLFYRYLFVLELLAGHPQAPAGPCRRWERAVRSLQAAAAHREEALLRTPRLRTWRAGRKGLPARGIAGETIGPRRIHLL